MRGWTILPPLGLGSISTARQTAFKGAVPATRAWDPCHTMNGTTSSHTFFTHWQIDQP